MSSPAATLPSWLPRWLRRPVGFVVDATTNFSADGVPRLAAAMSYFALLALAPTLLILNAIVGVLGGKVAATPGTEVIATASGSAATGIQQAAAWAGSYAPYVAVVLVVVGAVSVFGQFIAALELIWKVPPSDKPVRAFLRYNLLSLALLGVAALALVAALLVTGVIGMFGRLALAYAAQVGVTLPGVAFSAILRGLLVFVAASALFTVAFKVAPARGTRWRDVLPGALVTAALFLVGETWLSYYLGHTERFNVFGAFQFFVFLVVWIYYSALVALWGAELTRLLVLAAENRRGGAGAAAAAAAGPGVDPPASAG